MSAGEDLRPLEGRLLIEGQLRPGRLLLAGGRIQAIEALEPGADLSSLPIYAPGLIDLHIHGFGLSDPLTDLAGMAGKLRAAGTTSFLPTLFPAAPAELGARCRRLAPLVGAQPEEARVLGLHLEGPFVNPAAAGALPPADLAGPSPEALRQLFGEGSGPELGVARITLAPELPGALELGRELVQRGVQVSLGHSKASAEEARRAGAAGARAVTHLYNAMSGLHHREPGLANFALTEEEVFVEIIGDLVHVGREAFDLALRARGARGLCLVSDALAGAGSGCSHFHLHGRDHLIERGAAWYPPTEADGEPRLAGSALSQLEMVRLLVREGVLGPAEALTMASETPARALGRFPELGCLAEGSQADLIRLDGPELRLAEVWAQGQRLVRR